jgi:hypothetical protein
MYRLEPQQVGWGAGGGRGPFELPSECRGVVRPASDSSFADVEIVSCDVVLDNARRELKVGVRNPALGIFL